MYKEIKYLDIYTLLKWPKSYEEATNIHIQLNNFITKCNKEYYMNKPLISDELYDMICRHILHIEKIYKIKSILYVGFKNNINNIQHKYRLYSLDNAFSIEDLEKFDLRIKKYLNINQIEYVIEPKIDGMCINLCYKDGFLIRALTRGDGISGEDVTYNIMMIDSIPKQIKYKDYLEIRGEVTIALSDFNKDKFVSSRNEVISAIRQVNPNKIQSKIQFYPHGIMPYIDIDYIKIKRLFAEFNFLSNPYKLGTIYDIDTKFNIDIPTDGLVFKMRNLHFCERLGYTNKYPRYAIAYKFNIIKNITCIKNIEFSIGRTGIITPIAIIDEIILSGSKINKVCMHNFNRDIRIGDIVEVIKSGDIIPHIDKVFTELRKDHIIHTIKPIYCPSCKSILLHEKKSIRCTNNICQEQMIQRIIHFANILEIKLGTISIRKFYNDNILTKLEDIFNLPDLSSYAGWNIKSYNNLQQSIIKARNVTYDKFLYSLGILHIGSKVASVISKYGIEQDTIGKKIKESYLKNKDFIVHMEQYFTFSEIKENHSIITHKKIIITGTFNLSRIEMKNRLKHKGAIILNHISKSADFIIAGKNPGKNKIKFAEMNNIRIFYIF